MKNLENIVRANLCKVLDQDAPEMAEIDLNSSLFDDLGLTSLDMIVMMAAICRDAGVSLSSFSQDDMLQVRSPGSIIALLEQKALGRVA
jgi:acyl carrier protein